MRRVWLTTSQSGCSAYSKTQSGYTLIELLLYVSMVGAIMITIIGFFGLSTESRIKNQSINEVEQQGRAALEKIGQTVRNATAITAPTTGTSGAQLSVSVPTASLSPTIFNLSGTTLQIKEGSATATALTNSKVQATNLTIKNLTQTNTPGIVQVSLTLTRTNPAGRNEYNYTKTFTTSIARRAP